MQKKFVFLIFFVVILFMCVSLTMCCVSVVLLYPDQNNQNNSITNDVEYSYTNEEIVEYFKEIVLMLEFAENQDNKVRKWLFSPNLVISGEYTSEDKQCLNKIVLDFNSISRNVKILRNSPQKTNIDMRFMPLQDFPDKVPKYVEGNAGFFVIYNSPSYEITSAEIYISSTDASPKARCHLIREELTQSMGLTNDSFKYPDSIFYQDPSDTTFYSNLDRMLIDLLYNSDIRNGDSTKQVETKILEYLD